MPFASFKALNPRSESIDKELLPNGLMDFLLIPHSFVVNLKV